MNEKQIKIGGTFTFKQIRNGKVVDTWDQDNIVVNEGLNYILDAAFSGGTILSTWFLGLFKNNYTPTAADVIATFPGVGVASESVTEYTEATRPTWVDAGPLAQSITNSASSAEFTFGTAVTLYGAFLTSSNTKGGTSGKLAAASKFASARSMLVGDVLNVTYTLNISST